MVSLAAGSTLNSLQSASALHSGHLSEAQYCRIAVPLCYRINEPINLAIEFAQPQFEMSPFGIRFG